MNLREMILAAQDAKLEPVEVPEWGVTVYVRRRTVGDCIASRKSREAVEDDSDVSFGTWLLSQVALDANGNRIFTDEDAKALLDKSDAAVGRVIDAHARVNGLDTDTPEAPKN